LVVSQAHNHPVTNSPYSASCDPRAARSGIYTTNKPACEGAKGFGGLPRSLDVRDAVAVKRDGGCQDDKEHDHIREKRADADIHAPQLKFFGRVVAVRKCRINCNETLSPLSD
jgi:hypothetical protein